MLYLSKPLLLRVEHLVIRMAHDDDEHVEKEKSDQHHVHHEDSLLVGG